MKIMGIEVLPCPFCGSEDIRADRYCVECAVCGATGPDDSMKIGLRHKRLEDAIRYWNIRNNKAPQTKGQETGNENKVERSASTSVERSPSSTAYESSGNLNQHQQLVSGYINSPIETVRPPPVDRDSSSFPGPSFTPREGDLPRRIYRDEK